METKDIIRTRRTELGKSLQDVAKECGVTPATVMRWENGETPGIKLSVLTKLAKSLQVEETYLMGYTQISTPSVDKIAEELQKDENLRMLFSLAKDAKPEDLQLCADMLKRFKEQR